MLLMLLLLLLLMMLLLLLLPPPPPPPPPLACPPTALDKIRRPISPHTPEDFNCKTWIIFGKRFVPPRTRWC